MSGNKSRKQKPGNQPPTAQVSGGPAGGGGGPTDEELEIDLIRLDFIVASKAKIGEQVRLLLNGTTYEAHTSQGRLGDVPANYTVALAERNAQRAKVITLEKNPLWATILVS